MLGHLIRKVIDAARSPSAIYVLASVLGRAGAILLVPLYTRRLSPDEYGVYGLFASMLGLLPTVFSLGLNAGLSKAYFDEKEEKLGRSAFGAVARGVLLVSGVWALLGAVVALAFPPDLLAPLSRRHVVLLVFAAWGTSATGAAEYFFRIRERALIAAAFPLLSFAVTASLGLTLVVHFDRGVNGAVEAPSVASIAVGLASAVYLLATFGTGETLKATRRALVYSLPFVPHLLAAWLQTAGDRWVLNTFGSGRDLGTYYLATQLMSPVPMVLAAWNHGQWPAMGRIYRDEGLASLKSKLWSYERRALLLAVGAATAIGLSTPVFRLLVGPKFYPALAFMPAIALAQILDAPYYPDSTVLYYAGRTKRIVTITTLSTFLGLALSALLLPWLGIAGLLGARASASIAQMAAFAISARRTRLLPKSDDDAATAASP